MRHDPTRTLTRQEMDFGTSFAIATVGFLLVFGPFWLATEAAHRVARLFKSR